MKHCDKICCALISAGYLLVFVILSILAFYNILHIELSLIFKVALGIPICIILLSLIVAILYEIFYGIKKVLTMYYKGKLSLKNKLLLYFILGGFLYICSYTKFVITSPNLVERADQYFDSKTGTFGVVTVHSPSMMKERQNFINLEYEKLENVWKKQLLEYFLWLSLIALVDIFFTAFKQRNILLNKKNFIYGKN